MLTIGMADMVTLVILAWLMGSLLGGAGLWLAAAWYDHARARVTAAGAIRR